MVQNNSKVTVGPSRGDAESWAELLDATRKNSLIYRFELLYAEKYTLAEVQAIASSRQSDSKEARAAVNVLERAGLASSFKPRFSSR